ncbi:polyprenol phosphomannose-dependent alpha 1,6 mannosyltransferase MptB [Granulicoccus phenolivorans]|uniref:polyprenol phosphomannose-dependent alpha 1,6 mannosyltransferase MptB n=1 Tax=Granulicoccus phenolivorans TaxID=266854 RepID=UPI000412A15D|nr:polyprenol phosphomannose-dependent alpha 1,6 mannosyltransferase MptB [Granulicoccus phenolivorans]
MRSKTWLSPALIGLLGSVLVAFLPFSVGYLPDDLLGWFHRHLWWVRTGNGRWMFRILALAGSVLLFWAWLRLHPRHGAAPRRRIAALWALPMLLIPPLQTADPWAYAAQGWLLLQGQNPYEVVMGVPSPFTAGIYSAWLDTTAVYPPLALWAQAGLVALSGSHPWWSMIAMRVLAVAGFAGMVALAAPLARRFGMNPAVALWGIALNPLMLTQFVGGAHNDAAMLALVLAAFYVARRWQAQWVGIVGSMALIGLAAGFKQTAVIAAVGVALVTLTDRQRRTWSWPRIGLRVLLCGAIGGAVFLGTSFATGLGLGWLNPTAGNPNGVISHAPLSWIRQLLVRTLGLPAGGVDPVITVVSAVLFLAAAVWLLRRFGRSRPVLATAWILIAFALTGAALQPWYVLWGAALLPLCRIPARTARICVAMIGALLLSCVLQEQWPPTITAPLSMVLAAVWFRWGRLGPPVAPRPA